MKPKRGQEDNRYCCLKLHIPDRHRYCRGRSSRKSMRIRAAMAVGITRLFEGMRQAVPTSAFENQIGGSSKVVFIERLSIVTHASSLFRDEQQLQQQQQTSCLSDCVSKCACYIYTGLWIEKGLRLSTMLAVYKVVVVVTTILHGCASWTTYLAL